MAAPIPAPISAPISAPITAPAEAAPQATTAAQVEAGTQAAQSGFLLTPSVPKTIAIVAGAQITDIGFENTGAAQTGVPVTFGHVFAVGALLATEAVVGKLPDGTIVPLQLDVKAKHADGSIRHAVVSAVLPALAAAQTQTMALVKTSPYAPASATSPAALLSSGFTAAANLTIAGQQYSASADALLKSGTVKTWLSGAIVNEWQVSAPLKNAAGVDHPHLSAHFAIRHYNGSKRARVDVTIENTSTYEVAPLNVLYDAQIVVGGQSVYAKAGVNHYHHARWRKVFWFGQEPQVHIKHNTAYLISTKAVPNYDQSITFREATLEGWNKSWTGAKTEPMGVGLANPYMPSAGGRTDIGLQPGWAATYLLSMDKRAKEVTLGTADLSGSWSSHYRDKKTGRPVSLKDYPYMTIQGTYNDTKNPSTRQHEAFPACATAGACATPNVHDTSHQPNLVYLPYLVTGDYYYLEEIQFWAMWNSFMSNPHYREFGKGMLNGNQVRGQAWAMRALAEAAYITPDDDALKEQFNGFLANNLDYYNTAYTHNADANKLGALVNGGAFAYNKGLGIALWQDDFFTAAIGHAAELGFDGAKKLVAWKIKFPIGRMTSPGYCWIMGAKYEVQLRDTLTSPLYDNFAKLYAASNVPAVNSLTCGSAEMAAYFKIKIGEMTGYSVTEIGYPSNMQAALAYGADIGGVNGAAAWAKFMSRTVKPDYSVSPQFAIVPR